MIVSSKNPNTHLVYESLTKGTKIYALKDLSTISAHRGNHAEKMKRFASMAITETELKRLLDKAISSVNEKQDLVQAMAIMHEIRFRTEMICEENSLLELAYTYLMIEGEDDEMINSEYLKKKKDLVEAEIDLKGFFLRWALALVNNFSQKPDVDLLSYLEETKSQAERILKFI